MGTTQTTTGSNQSNLQFNPLSQGVYNQLVSGAGGVLGGYINNPFGNPFYNLGAGQSQRGAQQAGQNNMAALQQQMLTSGLGGQAGAGFRAAQGSQLGRANQAMSSQANVSNVLAALQRQMSASGTGLSFSPQLTGQSGSFQQQQSTGGLGTWLPQVVGAGLSAAMMGAGGMPAFPGMSAGQISGAFGGPTSAPTSISTLPNQLGMAGGPSGGLAGMLSGNDNSQAPPPLWAGSWGNK